MMRRIPLLAACAAAVAAAPVAAPAALPQSGGLVRFDRLEQYISAVKAPAPRDYNLAVLFVAGDRWPCVLCPHAERMFSLYASALHRGDYDREAAAGALPTYLGVVDASKSLEIVQWAGVGSVPHIGFLPATESLRALRVSDAKSGGEGGNRHFPYTMSFRDVAVDKFADSVRESLDEWTGLRDVRLRPPLSERFGHMLTILFAIATVVGVGLKLLFLARRKSYVMGICALIVYLLATSGLVWGMINGFRSTTDYDGRRQLFIWGNRRLQTSFEGFFMSATSILTGFAFWGAARLLKAAAAEPPAPATTGKRGGGGGAAASAPTARPGLRLAMAACLLCAAVAGYAGISVVGAWKGGMKSQFFPPANYVKGPLRFDRGNSF